MKKTEKRKTLKKRSSKSFLLNTFDWPAEISLYFGFTPITSPTIEKEDVFAARSFGKTSENLTPFEPRYEEKSSLLRMYVERDFSSLPHPLLLEYHRPTPRGTSKTYGATEIGLDVLGLSSPCAEAIVIRTACSILEEAGFDNLELSINSIGDKESIAEFERGLVSFIRKNINEMPAELRKTVKQNPFELLLSKEAKWDKWREEAPKSINFLSESSRAHFKEFIEYTEALGFNYRISPNLIGNPKFCSHTVFEIISETNSGPVTLAYGYRYERISKRAGLKRELPALSLSLSFKETKKRKKKLSKGISRARFYLVQIGYAAKLKTLNTIESLRKARIAVVHSIAKDKLSSQMSAAENFKTSHVIIIGQKEAVEDSIVVRDNETRIQETLPISELASYLKKLK
jgi:histidyl-tRNA synthetase